MFMLKIILKEILQTSWSIKKKRLVLDTLKTKRKKRAIIISKENKKVIQERNVVNICIVKIT